MNEQQTSQSPDLGGRSRAGATLRCRCGTLTGHVDAVHSAGRALCYCEDCQAFARFLGRPEEILNAEGGTEIVACLPRSVHFSTGLDQLACMSLSPRGLLRWYAGCCRTPVGNTPRNPRTSYVGLVRACLPGSDAAFKASFGERQISIHTASARGRVSPTRVAAGLGILKIMKTVLGARLTGKYKLNPFFLPDLHTPIREPQVLTLAERSAVARPD